MSTTPPPGDHADESRDFAQGEAEQALRAQVASLEQRLAEQAAMIEALNQQQEWFAYGVSHDLRAPLRAIDSFAALLASHLEGRLDDTASDHLDRIRNAAARMAALIDGLLDLSRAERAELRREPVDLGLLADWVGAELADAEPERVAAIVVQPDLHALGDERQLKLLMNQLLHNAWKFSRERERVDIAVGGERHGDRIVLTIRDHGSGFDMRYADKLFEPFQRLHGPEHGGGGGIGLAVAQRIVQRHGGRLWAQSEPGVGSTFFVELPAVAEDQSNA